MEGLRFPELIIILILVALLFGPQKIAGIGTGLGKAIRDFRSAMNAKEDEGARAAAPGPQALPPAKDPGGATTAAAGEAAPREPAAGGGEREPPTKA